MTGASVRRWLLKHTPLEPALLEGAGFETLVAEHIAATGGGEAAYVAALGGSPDEVDRLLAGIAVPETWLFRYPHSYGLLVEFLRRRLAAGAPALRMLSVGCATGQEPYCMAMAALHAGWPAALVSVGGLDRNREFLRLAAAAEYGATSIRAEIPAWAVPFLRREGERFGIDPAVRSVVWFRQADAIEPAALLAAAPCDVIFCRNLLIYLNAGARARLLDAIGAALAVGGLLFVGHAEQVITGASPLRRVPAPHAFALERIDAAAPAAEGPPALRAVPRHRVAAVGQRPRGAALATPCVVAEPQPAPQETLDDARDLADAGRIQDGETMVRSIIARRGPTAAALELLGMIRMAANDASGARRFFEQAVYLEPARSASLLQLAIISERAGDARRAATLWDRARRAASAGPEERRS